MADFVSLTCPAWNGKLQIEKDLIDKSNQLGTNLQCIATCEYAILIWFVYEAVCLRLLRYRVRCQSWGVVSLSPVVEGLKRVERGVDRTASELAIARLRKDIDDLAREYGSIGSDSQIDNQMLMYGIVALLAATGFGILGGVWQVALCFGLPGVLLTLTAVSAYSDNGRQKKRSKPRLRQSDLRNCLKSLHFRVQGAILPPIPPSNRPDHY